ncbi:MAG TPA: hypothetical protein VGC37_10595, partial [Friedmanniella sp.]
RRDLDAVCEIWVYSESGISWFTRPGQDRSGIAGLRALVAAGIVPGRMGTASGPGWDEEHVRFEVESAQVPAATQVIASVPGLEDAEVKDIDRHTPVGPGTTSTPSGTS